MSASKDKIIRKQQTEAGTNKRIIAAEKAAAERRKQNIQYIVVGVVLVIFFAFIFIYNSALPSRQTTAVTINGEKYSVAQLNYYYSAAYAQYYNEHYIEILTGQSSLDTQKTMAEQEYEPGVTWRDHFLDEAVNDIAEIQFLNEQAEAAGFVLDEEHEHEYDEALEQIETQWSENNYSSLQQFINLNYGKGVNMDLLSRELRRSIVAEAYAESLRDAYEYSDAQLADYYAEHADEYDRIKYSYYILTDEDTDGDDMAKDIEGFTEEEFKTYLDELHEGVTPNTNTAAGSNLSDIYSEWLLAPERKAGDSTCITDSEGGSSYLLLFLDRDTNDYSLVSFRHILKNAEDADEDGIISEDELNTAVGEVEALEEEWKSGDATEDSFGALVSDNTDDSGSSTNGGLYEDVYQGQMVENVNDWIFDSARKPGDVGIVTNEGSYTGAHLLYFVGAADETYAQSVARGALSSDQYDEWIAAQTGSFDITTSHLGMCAKNR